MSRDDDNVAAMKKRKKARNKRRNRKHRDTRLTPDESASGTEVVRARGLERDKVALEAEVDRLEQDTSQPATRISQLERELANLTDAHDCLKHEHGVYKAKATTLITEKDRHISDLKVKVRNLEKQLEQQLDESRQQFFEAQTSWSDKLHILEAQIFNMNRKMAEDSLDHEELQRQRAFQDSQLDELRMQAAVFHAQLAQAQQDRDREEEKCKKNQEQIQGLEEGKKTLLAKVSELEKQLNLALHSETMLKHGLKRNEAELETTQQELAKQNQVLASAEIGNKRLMEELEARQQQADKQSRLEEVTQRQESLESVAGQVDPFEAEPAAHVSNRTSVSDLQRNICEGHVSAGGICSRIFVGDVTLAWLPRSPAFNDSYLEEWPPPAHEWCGGQQRQQRQRHTTTAYDSIEPVLHQDHRHSVVLSTVVILTTVVVNLSESGTPPSSGGGSCLHCSECFEWPV
ncbi:chromosome partition protein Smc-like [Rhipicephalus sanguineus]|uniref:chromosome partition protein Smc-like n=1 Tax=Rhipicephalus sanguineus TaxID=34632 RepID=UPI0018942D66|nr:chromosome partition protein Smc-like [Rhipicephalus sanguineus]